MEDVGLALESMQYFVMAHYSIGIKDLRDLSEEEFGLMFTWASAAERLKAEEMDEMKDGAKSPSSMRVGSTDMGSPMPFSEDW